MSMKRINCPICHASNAVLIETGQREAKCPECGVRLWNYDDAGRPSGWAEAEPAPPDANQDAARIVQKSTEGEDTTLPADLEAAWAEWSKGIKGVDERGWTLLRAAFEAGAAAGANSAAAELGRRGGRKGGKARAAKLSPDTRSEIAKKAAEARWNKDAESEQGRES